MWDTTHLVVMIVFQSSLTRTLLPFLFDRSPLLYAATFECDFFSGLLFQVLSQPRGLAKIAFMIILLDLLHDSWFYFSHRFLHNPWMLRNVHYMHHQSTMPSAFTGYSFHW